MTDRSVRVRLSVDNASFIRGLQESSRGVSGLQRDLTSLRRTIESIDGRHMRVRATLGTSSWQREAELAAQRVNVRVTASLGLGNRRLSANIRAQFEAGTQASLQRQLDRMRLSVRVRPNVGPLPTPNASGGGGGGLDAGSLLKGAAGLGAFAVAVLPQVASGLSAATAGAVALTGQLGLAGAAGAGLLPVAGALGQAFATLKLGASGVSDALTAYSAVSGKATPAQLEAINEALAKLGPNQRAFVTEARRATSALTSMRGAVGEALFANLDKSLRGVTTNLLPLFRQQLIDTGGIVNRLGRGLADDLAGPLKDRLGGALKLNNDLLLRGSPIVRDLTSAALSLYGAVGPLALRIIDAAGGLTRLASASALAGLQSGKLVAFFDRAGDRAGNLLSGLGNLGAAFRDVFAVGNEGSAGLLPGFERLTQRFEDFTSSVRGETALRRWFDEGKDAAVAFGGLLGDVRREFSGLTGNVDATSMVNGLRSAVPYVADLVRALTGGGETGRVLSQAVMQIVQTLDRANAGGAVRGFVGTLSTMIQTVADVVRVVPGLAPALSGVAVALGSVAAVNLFSGGLLRLGPALLGLASPAGLAALAVGAVSLSLFKSRQDAKSAREEFERLSNLPALDLIDDQRVDQDRAKMQAAIKALADFKLGLQGATDIDTTKLAQLERDADLAVAGIARLDAEAARVNATTDRLAQSLGLTGQEVIKLAEAAKVDLKTATYSEAAAAIGRYRAESGGAAQASRDLQRDLVTLGDASTTAGEKADALRRIMQGLDGGLLDANEAAIGFQESIDRLSESATTNGQSLDINTAAGRANQSAIIDAKRALDERIASDVQAGLSGEALRKKVEEGSAQIRDQIIATYGNTEQTRKLLEQYNLLPGDIAVPVTTPGLDEAVRKVYDLNAAVRTLMSAPGMTIEMAERYAQQEQAQGNRPPQRATGGLLYGPGTGTSDSILGVNERGQAIAQVSAGEYVTRERSVQKYGTSFMHAVNQGLFPTELARGYATGGQVTLPTMKFSVDPARIGQVFGGFVNNLAATRSAAAGGGSAGTAQGREDILRFIRSTDPLPYVWGGVGPNGFDCSGLVGEVLNRVIGRRSYTRAFTTASIRAGMFGLRTGTGGQLSIGVTPGSGHMAGEYGGLPFEAASTKSGIKVGPSARSVNSFARKFFLPGNAAGYDASVNTGSSKSLDNKLDQFATGGLLREVQALGRLRDVAGDTSELVVDDKRWPLGSMLNPHVRDVGGPLMPGFTYNGTKQPEAVEWVRAPQAAYVGAGAGGAGASTEPIVNVYIGDERLDARVDYRVDVNMTELSSALGRGVRV